MNNYSCYSVCSDYKRNLDMQMRTDCNRCVCRHVDYGAYSQAKKLLGNQLYLGRLLTEVRVTQQRMTKVREEFK